MNKILVKSRCYSREPEAPECENYRVTQNDFILVRLDRVENCNLENYWLVKLSCEFKSPRATCHCLALRKQDERNPKSVSKICAREWQQAVRELDLMRLAAKRDRVCCAHMSFYGYTIGDEC